MSYVRPVQSGIIATEDRADSSEFIPVSMGFSNTGSFGSNSTFWVMQAPHPQTPWPTGASSGAVTGGVAAPEETIDKPWILVKPTPADNSTFNYNGFTQKRGTLMKYYCRRFREDGLQWVEGGTTNFSTVAGSTTEKVPTTPVLLRIDESVSGSNTTHTVILENNPASIDPVITISGVNYPTVVYYAQTTSPNFFDDDSRWRDTDNDGNVTSLSGLGAVGWKTDNTFTFNTASSSNTTYYYWALSWGDKNPGPESASISGYLQKTVLPEDSFGLQVFSTNGTYVLSSNTGVTASTTTQAGNEPRHMVNLPRSQNQTEANEVNQFIDTGSFGFNKTSDILWARPHAGFSNFVLCSFAHISGTPRFLFPVQYFVQRDSSLISLNDLDPTKVNSQDFGLQVNNKVGTLIFDSRKFIEGLNIKQISPVGTYPGGSYADPSNPYPGAGTGTVTNNLVYSTTDTAAFERTYVTVQAGTYTFTSTTISNNLQLDGNQVQINGFYFQKEANGGKIYYHSRFWVKGRARGGGGRINARSNRTEILVGELIS